jgi:hypothetical protein
MGKVVNVELKLDAKQAQKEFERLEKTIAEQKDITIEFEQELIKLERQLAQTPARALNRQAKYREEIVKVKSAIREQKVALKDLNNQRTTANKIIRSQSKATGGLVDEMSRNYGVTGTLNQLTGGLVSRYRDAYTAVTGLSKGLRGLKGALLATGIGAAVIAIGYLVENWDKVKESLLGVSEAQNRVRKGLIDGEIAANNSSRSLETYRDIVLDTNKEEGVRKEALKELQKVMPELEGVTLDQADALEKITKTTKLYIEQVQARAKAEAFAKLIAEAEAEQIRLQNEALTEQTGYWDTIKNSILSFGNSAEFARLQVDSALENQGEALEKNQTIIDALNKKFTEATNKSLEASAEVTENRTRKAVVAVGAINREGLGGIIQLGEAEITVSQTVADQKLQIQNKLNDDIIASKLAGLERDKIIAQQTVALTANTLGSVAELFGENSVAGKAAAIAQAIINSYLAYTQVLANTTTIPEPAGSTQKLIAGAGIMLSGLATVKKIVATPTPSFGGKGGGSRGGMSAGAGSVSSPQPASFNVVGASSGNQVAQTIAEQTQKPVKAFVVSDDVTTAQSMDRNIIESSSI